MLARSYVLFTFALLLLVAGVWFLWHLQRQSTHYGTQWQALLQAPEFEAGSYEKLESYLQKGVSSLTVLDAGGRVLYASDPDAVPRLTAGELECVPIYGAQQETTWTEFEDENGEQRFLLTIQDYQGGSKRTRRTILLDADYHIIFDSQPSGRTEYTEREIQYLTRRFPTDTALYRVPLDSGNIALLQDGGGSGAMQAEYQRRYQRTYLLWLLLIPGYLILAALFVSRMNRQIRRPVEHLNRAVVGRMDGMPIPAADAGGPAELQQIGQNFDALFQKLETSEKKRKRMLADISHDLKTPITVICGYADAICDGKVPPQQVPQELAIIRKKAETLNGLICAFQEYSKMEHPDFTLSCAETDLCEWCRQYLSACYDELQSAGFRLQPEIPEQPLLCRIDAFQLRRALDNLLSNSMRHNPVGTTLFFRVEPQKKTVLLRIGDDGCGIAPSMAEQIFEPFAVGSAARSSGGSGLGLSITKRIVEMHGGQISCSTAPADGLHTEFLLTLPRAT